MNSLWKVMSSYDEDYLANPVEWTEDNLDLVIKVNNNTVLYSITCSCCIQSVVPIARSMWTRTWTHDSAIIVSTLILILKVVNNNASYNATKAERAKTREQLHWPRFLSLVEQQMWMKDDTSSCNSGVVGGALYQFMLRLCTKQQRWGMVKY